MYDRLKRIYDIFNSCEPLAVNLLQAKSFPERYLLEKVILSP